jgi:hypothetical protein
VNISFAPVLMLGGRRFGGSGDQPRLLHAS